MSRPPPSPFRGGLWILSVVLAAYLLHQVWPELQLRLGGRPDVTELDFTRIQALPAGAAPVISSDEKINMDVYDRVHKAVVNISTTTMRLNFWRQVVPQSGQGSGFIIDEKGYILTNDHVVGNAQRITVTLGDGVKSEAVLIGTDPASDLAVIRIPASLVPTVAVLGDSDAVRVGQKAIAIGNPFGLSQTLTTGIVSALNRELEHKAGGRLFELIQTDAAINPGNSGGPLLDSNGRVIGINTAIFSVSGGYQGIGFAIPVNRARDVAAQLISTGRYQRPWLGIAGLALNPDLAAALNLPADAGVLVVEVVRGSPAYDAGLRGGRREVLYGNLRLAVGGDLIVSVDGQNVKSMDDLIRQVEKRRVGDRVAVEIVRDRRPQEVTVVLKARPSR